MTILEFITSKGWFPVGNCGCRNAMNMYRHQEQAYKGWEIWMDPQGKRMEVRRRWSPTDRAAQVKGIATVLNFETVYNHHLPQLQPT